jgi:hypothetical protein
MRRMEDYQWSLIDGPSIPRRNLMEDEFPDLPRRPIDRLVFLATTLLVLAVPGSVAALAFFAPKAKIDSAIVTIFAVMIGSAILRWIVSRVQDHSLAQRWATEKGFSVRTCILTLEELDDLSGLLGLPSNMQGRLTLVAEGDPRGTYRGILIIGDPIVGKLRLKFRYAAIGYSR